MSAPSPRSHHRDVSPKPDHVELLSVGRASSGVAFGLSFIFECPDPPRDGPAMTPPTTRCMSSTGDDTPADQAADPPAGWRRRRCGANRSRGCAQSSPYALVVLASIGAGRFLRSARVDETDRGALAQERFPRDVSQGVPSEGARPSPSCDRPGRGGCSGRRPLIDQLVVDGVLAYRVLLLEVHELGCWRRPQLQPQGPGWARGVGGRRGGADWCATQRDR
jgi:hypothetical protein